MLLLLLLTLLLTLLLLLLLPPLQVNPAVFTIVTFPFLFAVMFGDLGHGALMLGVAALLLVNEKKMARQDLGDILGMLFGGNELTTSAALNCDGRSHLRSCD